MEERLAAQEERRKRLDEERQRAREKLKQKPAGPGRPRTKSNEFVAILDDDS